MLSESGVADSRTYCQSMNLVMFFNFFDFSVSLTVEVTVSNRNLQPCRSVFFDSSRSLTVGSTVSGTKSIVLIDA